jgi:hypothetical protein
MKKLLLILLFAGAVYGAWKYMEAVQQHTTQQENKLKPSENAAKELEK